jgi:polyhydroxyalkanoate synthesis regulator protein
MPASDKIRIIKRYAQSRLYDPQTTCYRTVEELRRLVARGILVKIVDTETGDDVTRALLA